MTRKRILPPSLPPPESRLDEIRTFMHLLADRFIDYDYYDVYDSVFRQRVDVLVQHLESGKDGVDPETAYVHEFGVYIQSVNSTKCRDFLKFFKLILEHFETP